MEIEYKFLIMFMYALGSGIVIGYSYKNSNNKYSFDLLVASLLSWFSLALISITIYLADKKTKRG